MYVFLKVIEEYNIYIKIGIDENKACIISFHEVEIDESPLKPFKR